jgi:two-component sensor histidine kinase
VEFGQMVRLEVWDDGAPLPETFDLSAPRTLGLQIVRTLVESDLRGNLRLENQEVGVLATVEFPKQPAE